MLSQFFLIKEHLFFDYIIDDCFEDTIDDIYIGIPGIYQVYSIYKGILKDTIDNFQIVDDHNSIVRTKSK